MTRRGTLVGLALVLFAAAAGGVRAEEGGDRLQLRVGVSPNYPPIAFKENGELRGVEIDFGALLRKDFGVEVTYVESRFEDLIPALKKRRIDVVMSGMSITVDRRSDVDFTDPYQRVGQMALIRKADRGRLTARGAMKAPGVRVGVERETTGELFARRRLEQAVIVPFDSPKAAIEVLRRGELDFFIHDAPTIWRAVGRPQHEDPDLTGVYRPLTEEYLAWAVRREDAELKGFLNAALAHWRTTGEVEAILARWMPVRKVGVGR